jgi:hypothetical protein
MDHHARGAIEKGGIYWECGDCGAVGVIPAGHPLAKTVREKLGPAYQSSPFKQCGIKFSSKNCPICKMEMEQ